jgi:hypothetical protein
MMDGIRYMPDDASAQIKTFVALARAVFVVAVTLAGVIWVASYLTAVGASEAKCAGQEWLQGYRNRIPELMGLPFFSVVVVVLVGAMASGRSRKIRDLFEVFDMVVWESMQVTMGMVVAYSSLFGMLAGLGLVTSVSIMRYKAIASYCLATAALN